MTDHGKRDLTWIGVSYERTDAFEKAKGLAVYGTDVTAPRMLHAKMLRSPLPHAKILHVDLERAKRLPGVRAVVCGRDYPESNFGTHMADQPIFADDRVRYVGEAVAGVAAVDQDAALEALERIHVDYEELRPLFDPEEAMAPNAILLHPDMGRYEFMNKLFSPVPGTNICNHFRLRRGDVEHGFRESDLIFEDTFHNPMIQHCPMEPHACVAQLSSQGKITIWSNTQGAYLAREQVAKGLRLPQSDVRIISTFVGGAFGGKIGGSTEVLASALALQTDHLPVKLELTREEEFVSTFVRQPVRATYKTGVKRNGDFVARQVRLVFDSGAYGDYEILVCRTAGYTCPGPYRIPNLWVDSYSVYTNKPVSGAFRGFGVPETCFGYEGQIDRIAHELGFDPIELRLRNGWEEGDLTSTGQGLKAIGLKECIRRANEALGEKGPSSAPGKRRGRAIACMSKNTVSGAHVASAIKINEDGSAVLVTSAVEHGQGAHTVLLQIAAEVLGLDPRQISVSHPDTAQSPYGWATSASKTTFFDGNAVAMAAQDAKDQLLNAAGVILEAAPEDLETRDGRIFPHGPRSAPSPLAMSRWASPVLTDSLLEGLF